MARHKTVKNAKGSAGQNRKNSDAYIAKYRQKNDVTVTPSGLMYRVIEQGNGATPTMEDSVNVHQRIWLSDGTVIADTYKTGETDRFSLSEAIEGLQEGLPLMQEGARFEFVIPPDLAWGKRGAGNKIGANAVLTFDIRLIEVTF